MAIDTSINIPGIETEPAAPNQGPYSGFPGYEDFRIGDPIPGMPGSVVGGEIVNDAGDRWNWLKGDWDLASKPQEPSSPFDKFIVDLQKLQPPVAFTPQSEQRSQGSGQYFAAPPAQPLIQPAFGPVTRSGYSTPPVDPMSYYNQQPVDQQTDYSYNPNAPTRWYETRPPGPTPTQQIKQDLMDTGGNFDFGPSNLQNEIMDPNTGVMIPVVPNPDFVEPRVLPNPPRLGLPEVPPNFLDPVFDYDQWKWLDRLIPKPDKPADTKPDENVKEITEEEVSQIIGDQTPVPQQPPPGPPIQGIPPEAPSTPGLPNVVNPRPGVLIPNLDLAEPPKTTTPVRIPGRIIPFNMPTEVPIPPRRTVERLAPGYFKDINYDPDEILAAAMRVLRGRGAGRSLME